MDSNALCISIFHFPFSIFRFQVPTKPFLKFQTVNPTPPKSHSRSRHVTIVRAFTCPRPPVPRGGVSSSRLTCQVHVAISPPSIPHDRSITGLAAASPISPSREKLQQRTRIFGPQRWQRVLQTSNFSL